MSMLLDLTENRFKLMLIPIQAQIVGLMEKKAETASAMMNLMNMRALVAPGAMAFKNLMAAIEVLKRKDVELTAQIQQLQFTAKNVVQGTEMIRELNQTSQRAGV